MSPVQAHVPCSTHMTWNIGTHHHGGNSWSRFYQTSRFPRRIQCGRWHPLAHPPSDLKSPWDICIWISPFPTLNTTLVRPWWRLPDFTCGLVVSAEVEAACCNYSQVPPDTISATSSIPEPSISLPSAMPQPHRSCASLFSHNPDAGWERSLWNKASAFVALSSISLWWLKNKKLRGKTPPQRDSFALAVMDVYQVIGAS